MKFAGLYGSICMRCGHDTIEHHIAGSCQHSDCQCRGMVWPHKHEWENSDKPFTKKCTRCSLEMPYWVPLPLDHPKNWEEWKSSEVVFSVEELMKALENPENKVITFIDDVPKEAETQAMKGYYERRNLAIADIMQKIRERREKMLLDMGADLSVFNPLLQSNNTEQTRSQ